MPRTTRFFVLLSLFIPAVTNASVFVPIGLNPGDEYHLAFVTAGTRYAYSGDIDDYNNFVQTEAALNPTLTGTDMGVTYAAIGSTGAVDARDNAFVEAPVYLLDGTKIANGFADMWDGSLESALNIDQFLAIKLTGSGLTDYAFTGSEADGRAAYRSLGNPHMTRMGTIVDPTNWISSGHSVGTPRPLYALSEKLTVPIPEPSTFIVWSLLGTLAITVGWWRQRKHA